MDSRELKKRIMYDMAIDYQRDMDARDYRAYVYLIGLVYEKNEHDVTEAEIKRFEKVLQKIVDNFESKLN
tara:strand:- start:179 stop:388 length:210 start_codon:yes stop_codon:yes gene_type:complete